jgi:type IV secretory pathway TrbF-like protein
VVRASDSSFQVKWSEQVFERGTLVRTERWTAILSTITQPPRTSEAVRKNPLGLYVNGLAWSRELDPAAKPERKSP